MTATQPVATESTTASGGSSRGWLARYGWLVIGCAIAVAVPPLVRTGETAAQRQSRDRIQQMTQDERDQLEANQKKLHRLTVSEQQTIREIHQVASTDRELEETVRRYHEWLTNLPKVARDQVLKENTPEERIAVVKRLTGDNRWRPGLFPQRGGPRWPRLPRDEYENALRVIARHYSLPEEASDSSDLARLAHHVQVVEALMKGAQPEIERPPLPPDEGPPWRRVEIPDDLRKELMAVADRVPGGWERKSVLEQNGMLVLLIGRSLLEEMQEVATTHAPSEDELQSFMKQLPEQRRMRVERRPGEDRVRQLRWEWLLDQLPRESAPRADRIHSLIVGLIDRMSGMPQFMPERNPAGRFPDDGNGPGRSGFGRPGTGDRFRRDDRDVRPGDGPPGEPPGPPPGEPGGRPQPRP